MVIGLIGRHLEGTFLFDYFTYEAYEAYGHMYKHKSGKPSVTDRNVIQISFYCL